MPDFNSDRPFVIKLVGSNAVLDVFDGSTPSRQQIVLYEYHGRSNQIFTYRDGLIYSQKNGLVLDVSQQSGDGHTITTYQAHGGKNQQWKVKDNGKIKSKLDMVIKLRSSAPPIHPLSSAYVGEKDKGYQQKFELINV